MANLRGGGKRRVDTDIHKLILENKHEVTILEDPRQICIKYFGAPNTLYREGAWNIKIHLTEEYPFKAPLMTFLNRIFHPNIHEESGIVSPDVANEAWTARHTLTDLVEYFLPLLMADPNIMEPINKIAYALYLHAPEEYARVVEEYVRQYAKP